MNSPMPQLTAAKEASRPVFHDIFRNRIRLDGKLTTRTGLHIGAGATRQLIASDQPVVRDAMGRPFIPGSSLKGVLRSAAEALLRSFPRPEPDAAAKTLLWSCDVVGSDPCVDDERSKALRNEGLAKDATSEDYRNGVEAIWKESCTVCRLFGSVALASRVRFPDLLVAETPPSIEIRNGVGIDRDKEQAALGILYDFEAVPPGTEFSLIVLTDNVKDFEVGLLLYLFDELHRGQLSLGGKTSRGLGQMTVQWANVEEISLDSRESAKHNPFSQLLIRQQLLEQADDPKSERELPIPEDGDQELWQRIAESLDRCPSVDESVLGELIEKESLGTKKQLNVDLNLGPPKMRRYREEILDQLTKCGRLVSWEGKLMPRIFAEAAQHKGAEIDRRLIPVYKRFVRAMETLWREANKCSVDK